MTTLRVLDSLDMGYGVSEKQHAPRMCFLRFQGPLCTDPSSRLLNPNVLVIIILLAW